MDAPSFDETQSNRHLNEAKANYTLFEKLRDQQHWGWATVVLFYSALHLVEAYKCIHHPHLDFKGHSERNDYVFDNIRTINIGYRSLYSMSRSVRYDLFDCKEVHLKHVEGDYNLLWIEMNKLGLAWEV